MSIVAIIEILKNGFAVLAYFFNPELRKKRDRKKDLARFRELERLYREALAGGDPQKVSQIAKEMEQLRKEYAFVNKKGG